MTDQNPSSVVRQHIEHLLDAWPGGYQGLRAVLEELSAAIPIGHYFAPRQRAQDYLVTHCQICGQATSAADRLLVHELEMLRAGTTDPSDLAGQMPEPFCSPCYVRHVEEDDTAWVAELSRAQQEQPTGLFGADAATVRMRNHDLQRQRELRKQDGR